MICPFSSNNGLSAEAVFEFPNMLMSTLSGFCNMLATRLTLFWNLANFKRNPSTDSSSCVVYVPSSCIFIPPPYSCFRFSSLKIYKSEIFTPVDVNPIYLRVYEFLYLLKIFFKYTKNAGISSQTAGHKIISNMILNVIYYI